jgi:hypothetical protein
MDWDTIWALSSQTHLVTLFTVTLIPAKCMYSEVLRKFLPF